MSTLGSGGLDQQTANSVAVISVAAISVAVNSVAVVCYRGRLAIELL
jgi:hypothetical protein